MCERPVDAAVRLPRRDARAVVRSQRHVRPAATRGRLLIAVLALKSLRNRRLTVALTVLSIALASALLIGVERIRQQYHEGFATAVSGTDLIVGARTSPANLLLASVFRIGNATSNVRWDSYRAIAAMPEVAWTIPISLGDSHRGFRVLGTSDDYFAHFRYGSDELLRLTEGTAFVGEHDAVLGAEVARTLGYRLGQTIVAEHGSGEIAFVQHRNTPFRVVGILAHTGTPVDRAVHVPLAGIDAMHRSDDDDDPLAAALRSAGHASAPSAAEARTLTAILVGLKSRATALSVKRRIDDDRREPLTAILPGVALLDVWEIAAGAEKALTATALLVVLLGLASMLIALLTSLGERRREMAVLRALGARPWHVFALVVGEAALVTTAGVVLGVGAMYLGLAVGGGWLEQRLGLALALRSPSSLECRTMLCVVAAGVAVGLIPAWRSYRVSLTDGMTIRH